jgi:vacuolar protein sorting-associated protein 3
MQLDLHKEALSILVNDLQDSTTAEAYCSLGGQVIPSRIATMIGDELGLGAWASLIVGKGRLQRTLIGGSGVAPSSEEEKKKQMLTKMLVETYISSGKGRAEQAVKILNAQAINLEVGEVR